MNKKPNPSPMAVVAVVVEAAVAGAVVVKASQVVILPAPDRANPAEASRVGATVVAVQAVAKVAHKRLEG